MRRLLLFLTSLLLAAPSHGAGRPVGVTTITFTKPSVTTALPFFRRYVGGVRSAGRVLVRPTAGVVLTAEPKRSTS